MDDNESLTKKKTSKKSESDTSDSTSSSISSTKSGNKKSNKMIFIVIGIVCFIIGGGSAYLGWAARNLFLATAYKPLQVTISDEQPDPTTTKCTETKTTIIEFTEIPGGPKSPATVSWCKDNYLPGEKITVYYDSSNKIFDTQISETDPLMAYKMNGGGIIIFIGIGCLAYAGYLSMNEK